MIRSKSLATLASLTLLAAACAPIPYPVPPQARTGSEAVPQRQGTDVRVAVRIADPNFRTLLAPGQTRLDHYVLTLKQGPATISGPTNDADGSLTFNGVAVGNGYTIEIDAVDASGSRVLTGVGTSASFDVVNGQVYATTDVARAAPLANVTVAITFLDENIGPTVRVTGSAVATNSAGISFLNLLNWKSVALEKAVGTDPTNFAVTAVEAGATAGNSHRLYTYFVDTATGQATVAKAQNIPGTAAGDVSTSPILKPFSMVQAPTATGFNENVGARWVGTDTSAVHYNGDFDIFRNPTGGGAPAGNTVNYPAVESYTANLNGTIFYHNAGVNVIRQVVANSDPGTATTGTLPGPLNHLTVDAAGSFYWLDGAGAARKLPAAAFTPAGNDTGDVVTIHAGPYTGIAVDAFGNAYLSTATTVTRAKFDGSNYDAPAPWVAGAGVLTNLVADPAGNLYFLDGAAAGNLKMRPAGQNAVYTVTGTAAVQVQRFAIAADGTLVFVNAANAVHTL